MKRYLLIRWSTWTLAAALALAGTAWGRVPRTQAREPKRLVKEKTGTLTTREGLRLRLVADIGNVRILTQAPAPGSSAAAPAVSYKVRIETDARRPGAQNLLKQFVLTASNIPTGVQLSGQVPSHGFRGRLWVNYEVSVPRNYSLEVLTQAGNIETPDINGRISLITAGGNINVGRVGGPESSGAGSVAVGMPVARLETQGGHITVQEVNGDLRATTAGGHINVGNVTGDAILRSGGGHIRAATISGNAELETGGGNISVQHARSRVTATTGGGQIDFGETQGAIRARTAGGGIRVLRVAGPTELATNGGSIFLTKVESPVRASTAAGTITAWFAPLAAVRPSVKPAPGMRKPSGPSQLESGQGDIVVYLPLELPLTIEATIEMAGDHRIEADPSIPVKISYSPPGPGGRSLRGEGTLNGGGEVLRLKTVSGNILLRRSDTAPHVLLNQQMMEQMQRRMEQHLQRQLESQMRRVQEQMERIADQQRQQIEEQQREASRLEASWRSKLEQFWLGGIHIGSEAQQRKLIHSVPPVYPDVARQAGIEGTVRLRAYIDKDGAVQNVKALSGHPLLAEAAMQAVKQWRYEPTLVEGKPVNVITAVTVEFRLK